jgi:hypothetical protein
MIRTLVSGFVVFVVFVLLWQILIIITSRGVAHGMGFYRAYGPTFVVTGILLVAFGLFLRFR